MTTASERPTVGVGVVLIVDDEILLIKRRGEPQRGKWAVPGGKVGLRETLKDAARRETKEETGLDVVVGDHVWVGEVIDGDFHLVLIDFEAELVGGELKVGDDADAAEWVPLAAVREYPLTPTMVDLLDTLGA